MPREGDDREALRVLNTTREGAVHARTQSINAVHALVVAAPDSIRDRLRDLTTLQLLRRCSALRVRCEWTIDVQATVIALRSIARRAVALETEAEADEPERAIEPIIARVAPALIARRGVGLITGAVIFCSWSHPGRCRSEAAFAALGGISPIPASSGQTVRDRLNRCGDRQLNRAIHTVVVTRSRIDPDTKAYIERRTAQGKTPAEIRRCLKRYVARELFRLLEHVTAPDVTADVHVDALLPGRGAPTSGLDRT